MKRSKRMQPVQRVAQTREQAAVQEMGESQQSLAAQQAKLEELRGYRDQYARAFETSAAEGLDAGRIRDFRIFLQRLNEAIRQQEGVISQCRQQCQQTRQQWIKTHSHSQAVDKVVERYRQQEQKQQQSREQKELDERAQRLPSKE